MWKLSCLLPLCCLHFLQASTVIQVHLNCDNSTVDQVFFFENRLQCTSFPGQGSYRADCLTNKMVRYATLDCSGPVSSYIDLNVCIESVFDPEDDSLVTPSLLYQCTSLPIVNYGKLSYARSSSSCSNLLTQSLGFNLNQCTTSYFSQSDLYRRTWEFGATQLKEAHFFDSNCLDPEEDSTTILNLQVGVCMKSASSYSFKFDVVRFGPLTSAPSMYPTSLAPSRLPSTLPTSKSPLTQTPTRIPTKIPTGIPTQIPTGALTQIPTGIPTKVPNGVFTNSPVTPMPIFTLSPSLPSKSPSLLPSKKPTTLFPTKRPRSLRPTTRFPSKRPVSKRPTTF